ncbi:MAG: glycosyltransferase family 25 protein [Candidatus Accumulibacter sp.]|jgi:GR25 family glycosyltransferase involved in LPS biosynthesis|nr:glycosyltransferase family 25 protein [Accumulibacter sp.]
MNTYYINLESAEARRHFVEKNFRQYGDESGRLHRVEAVDAARVVADAVPGKISDAEKACFLSHRRAIDCSRRDGTHSLIVEDDVRFGPSTFKMLDRLGDALDAFDIVFTNVIWGNIDGMLRLFFLRRKLLRDGTIQVFDLKEGVFSGAMAYVVNARSKEKILDLIDGLSSYELPYDLQLRDWGRREMVKAGVVFPFLTTPSSHSDHSTIQPANFQVRDAAFNAYCKLMWMDFEQAQENPLGKLNELDASYFDEQSLFFGQIISVLLSPNFVSK